MTEEENREDGLEIARFQLEGMSCSCEAQIVEKRLKRLKAVRSFNVNPVTNKMMVTFDPEGASVREILKAVSKAGLKAVQL